MAIRVTKPVTKYGRYYAAGEVLTDLTGEEWSMYRLYGWEKVSDPEPIGQLNKPDLLQLAQDRGLETDGLTKKQLVEALS